MNRSPADLMRRNLLDVFNEPGPARRAVAIAETYHEDVVWHEPGRIVHGRKDLERRAAEVRAENPDWIFPPWAQRRNSTISATSGSNTGPPTNRRWSTAWISLVSRTASSSSSTPSSPRSVSPRRLPPRRPDGPPMNKGACNRRCRS
ncbi:nuclear transport factor 2 family protein [Nocardia sp. NPDC049707]|uniref:nuclear transport factor 2 family protein n=1 Tax=Nocardia sp. NPDC049707 TaxID=3154735 RepID=UPI0034335BD2